MFPKEKFKLVQKYFVVLKKNADVKSLIKNSIELHPSIYYIANNSKLNFKSSITFLKIEKLEDSKIIL